MTVVDIVSDNRDAINNLPLLFTELEEVLKHLTLLIL